MTVGYALILIMFSQDRYQDWIEHDINQYAGEYVYFEFMGSQVKTQEKIVVSIQDNGLLIRYSINSNQEKKSVINIQSNAFKQHFKSLKGKAKFMMKLPPPNAKGKIENGILIGGKFFSLVGPLEQTGFLIQRSLSDS